ncbi:TMV resistance protein N-like [Punica granatum]|uniref:ADP-ribosyl cyclase/cyclic ADP-ribose hydrolase n=1 Tax=Punica granatum TaxID=22663 RepID=A0A6P8CAB4_PUNGR|nr:TMV resistance protein N-like [Punica granatum]
MDVDGESNGYPWWACLCCGFFSLFASSERSAGSAAISSDDAVSRDSNVLARHLSASPAEFEPGYEYEVFLSFRGPDTRKGFTDFLYNALVDAGIRTFLDDEALLKGEQVGPNLLEAIKQSKVSVSIFSRGYASSKWCLKELAQMVECRNSAGQMIIPIFYDVAPNEICIKDCRSD